MSKVLLALTLLVVAAPAARTVSAQRVSPLPPTATVTPSSGRPGDTIYLSGGNFPRGVNLHASLYCPGWYDVRNGNAWEEGTFPWQANTQGTFAAWPLTVPTPLKSRRTQCTLYVGAGANSFQVALLFTILGPHDPRSRHPLPLSAHVRARQGTCLRSGIVGMIHSAGGATLSVQASGAHGHLGHTTMSLPWTGSAVVQLAGPAACGQRVRITLQARLGRLTAKRQLVLAVSHAGLLHGP